MRREGRLISSSSSCREKSEEKDKTEASEEEASEDEESEEAAEEEEEVSSKCALCGSEEEAFSEFFGSTKGAREKCRTGGPNIPVSLANQGWANAWSAGENE
jgi:hypothetical protein